MDAVAASGLSVLTTDTDAPVVTETAVKAAALHALHVLAQALVQEVGILLAGLAILHAALTIEHPCRNLELQGVADDCDDLIDLVCSHLAGSLVHVDVTLLADYVRETATDTFDG